MKKLRFLQSVSDMRQCYVGTHTYDVGTDIDSKKADEFIKLGFAIDPDAQNNVIGFAKTEKAVEPAVEKVEKRTEKPEKKKA